MNGENYYYTYYYYDIKTDTTDSTKTITQNELLKGNYFLATRGINSYNSRGNFCLYRIQEIATVYRLDGSAICRYEDDVWYNSDYTQALRAIVTLNPDLETKDIVYPGDETGWNII